MSGPEEREQTLHTVVGINVLELASGLDHQWLEPIREQLRRRTISAHLQFADLFHRTTQVAPLNYPGGGNPGPTNEEMAAKVMEAYRRVGDDVAIAAELRRLRSALREIDESLP